MFHVDIDDAGIQVSAVLLPLDRFFEMRASAAIRLWHGLTGAILVPAAWSRTSKTGGDYLFLELYDPSRPDTVWCNLYRKANGPAVLWAR